MDLNGSCFISKEGASTTNDQSFTCSGIFGHCFAACLFFLYMPRGEVYGIGAEIISLDQYQVMFSRVSGLQPELGMRAGKAIHLRGESLVC